MAAKALTPLISVQKSTSCMQQLVCEVQELRNDDETVTDQNTLHGLCLQLCSLLERDLLTATCEDLKTIVGTCSQLSWICQFTGVCFVTKAVYLDIVLLLYHTDKFEGKKIFIHIKLCTCNPIKLCSLELKKIERISVNCYLASLYVSFTEFSCAANTSFSPSLI